jgi:hypothetical protein
MTQGGRNGLFSAPEVSLLFPTPTFARFAPVGRPNIPDFRYRWMMPSLVGANAWSLPWLRLR